MKSHLRPRHWAAVCTLVLASTSLTGCASFYVDNGLKAADTAVLSKPANPRPVQLFFGFETEGKPNAIATQQVQPQVIELVRQSGLFSDIRTTASPDTAILQLTINNIPLSKDAGQKGALTGLTLGLVGNTVGDGYACKLHYKRSDSSPAIEATASHAIYTSIGAGSSPEVAATKSANITEAASTMVRQAVLTLLDKLSKTPEFQAQP